MKKESKLEYSGKLRKHLGEKLYARLFAKILLYRRKTNGNLDPTVTPPIKAAKFCQACIGSGKVDKEQCPACNGLGKVLHPHDDVRLRTGLHYRS